MHLFCWVRNDSWPSFESRLSVSACYVHHPNKIVIQQFCEVACYHFNFDDITQTSTNSRLLFYLLPDDCFGGGRFVFLNPELRSSTSLKMKDVLKINLDKKESCTSFNEKALMVLHKVLKNNTQILK